MLRQGLFAIAAALMTVGTFSSALAIMHFGDPATVAVA